MLASEHLTSLIKEALQAATNDCALGPISFPALSPGIVLVEKPKQDIHGDLTCGIAMRLASGANMPPIDIANVLASYIRSRSSWSANAITELSVAPVGFLNFKLGSAWLVASLIDIHKMGDDFGRHKSGLDQKVSINYGAPLRSRSTFYGQSLGNLFRWSGYEVCEDPDSVDFDSCDVSINIISAQNGKKIKQLRELNAKVGLNANPELNASRQWEMILLQPIKLKQSEPFTGNDIGQRAIPRGTFGYIPEDFPAAVAEQSSTTLVDVAADAEILNTMHTDTLRYCLVDAEPEDQATLDPEVSGQASRNNSAFYVSYAHARCCAMMRQALDSRINVKDGILDPPLLSEAQFQDYLLQYKTCTDVFEDAFSINSELFAHQKKLVMTLQSFPAELSEALVKRQPGRITRFARTLADDMNKWCEVNRVIADNTATTRANLGLIMATRQVLANTLAVIGVSAPTKM